jgi:hypothetical protein
MPPEPASSKPSNRDVILQLWTAKQQALKEGDQALAKKLRRQLRKQGREQYQALQAQFRKEHQKAPVSK